MVSSLMIKEYRQAKYRFKNKTKKVDLEKTAKVGLNYFLNFLINLAFILFKPNY